MHFQIVIVALHTGLFDSDTHFLLQANHGLRSIICVIIAEGVKNLAQTAVLSHGLC